jgi:transcription initiation factor TFIIB
VSRESVGTVIGTDGDRLKTARLNKYNNRLDYRTRALKDGLREVRSLCAALDLPEPTVEHAAHLYRRALSVGLVQGRSQESIAGAAVYVATRTYHNPVTLVEVAETSMVEKSTISGAYRILLQELDIGVKPPEPTEFLAKVATNAGLSYRVERRAGELLRRVVADGEHVGQNPAGVAAAALYAGAQALGKEVTQETLAEAAGVSIVTLSRQWQSFKPYLG